MKWDSAMSSDESLHGCYINSNWEETKLAIVAVARKVPDGLTFAGFLVDVAWRGLKDVWGQSGLMPGEIQDLLNRYGKSGERMVRCDLRPARELVYDGIAWARKWDYPLPDRYERWLKYLGPRDADTEPDLSRFGKDGKPMMIGQLHDFIPQDMAHLERDDLGENEEDLYDEDEPFVFHKSYEDILESVRKYYEDDIDWEPDVKRLWVEDFLKRKIENGASVEEVGGLWEDTWAFMSYQDRSEHHDLSKLPFWEYSVCLGWMSTHVLGGGWHRLTLENARRFLGHLQEFYAFLVEQGHIDNRTELDNAYEHICGGDELRLVERIPYTGFELWKACSSGGRDEEVELKMHDLWLLLLRDDMGESWDQLMEEAQGVPSAELKVQLIRELREKLGRLGDVQRNALFITGEGTDEDFNDAGDWFYTKEIETEGHEST